ncbi:hypothetical protein H310_13256 [Aphanomyces invadans]|uniref:Uncharacterized protein n=1 Tax=Aphanomyces invadans TaxID=157072 RepID=A0A024TFJ0_9STRA|nr:hypothetical protein H310_13256 [Aphanomyces invadans]ETV92356.1 hypothetical protein H310_13256 [Aphanomyces invadans]|eukprot:XP_008878907.1 hypothetical protein H310_13256 [Aphanomyces invadans]
MTNPPRRSLFGSPVAKLHQEDNSDPPGLTFQALDRMKVERHRLESRRMTLVDTLWHAAVADASVLTYDGYARLHRAVSKYCTDSSASPTDMDADWALDIDGDGVKGIDHRHFHELMSQLVEMWGLQLQASSDELLESMVQELVDPVSHLLRDGDRVNPHAIATSVHDMLECVAPNGSWVSSNATVVRTLDIDSNASRYATTAAAVAYLDRIAGTDSRWISVRCRSAGWLAKHEGDKHFTELQALLHRLHVSFDVAPLMRLRLDPLLDAARTLVVDAFVAMASGELVPCLEWLRTLTPSMWRVLASPIGAHSSLASPPQVQAYLFKLSRFTLIPQLCAFCDTASILDKQELLLFMHTLSPLELGHFRETVQRPNHKFATTPGVKVAVAFFSSLSAMQRMAMKSELYAFARGTGDVNSYTSPKDTTMSLLSNVPPPPRPRHRQTSPKPLHGRTLEPILRPSESAPLISSTDTSARPIVQVKPDWTNATSPALLWNGDVYSPPKSATAWSRSHLSREKQYFEARYFDRPTISRHDLAFSPPQHAKHLSLPQVTERHISDLSLDQTWVPPADLSVNRGAT